MRPRPSFEPLLERLAQSQTTLSERELLEVTHWQLGEDARLREDPRLRETPWGQWMRADDLLANDAIHRWLHAERRGMVSLAEGLERATEHFGRRCVVCPRDPRLVLRGEEVHLASAELTLSPMVETEVGELEKYTSHLPLHSLKAAAASEPAGQWGPRAETQSIETLGWVRVSLKGRSLNDRMFLAQVEGHSMDDGRSGLVDGGLAVFELWPKGSTQHQNVLVRGAFHDPETGSYAVKKYVADERDDDNGHQRISLVSLNPDKDRFPDIALTPDTEGDVTVVAKVVQPLGPGDYERVPKPRRRPGRRALLGDEGLAEQGERLSRRLAAFFGESAERDEVTPDEETPTTGWVCRVVALALDAGGIHLEVGPLTGLPAFVKKVRLVGQGGWDSIVLAANLKAHTTRVRVPPGRGPWSWEAMGFEDEAELGLEVLNQPQLDGTSPMVFRVDSEGVGQQVQSTTLSLGQAYRILLPPELSPQAGGDLGEGWRLWTLDLDGPIAPQTHEALLALGLSVGEAWPRLEWSLPAPATWKTNARGVPFPSFESGTEPIVVVSGVDHSSSGETLALFLQGPLGTERLTIRNDGHYSLGTPAAGRWAISLLHSRTAIPTSTLMFEVASDARRDVSALVSAQAPAGLESLVVTGPPGWPVTLQWRVLHTETLATIHVEEDGTADLAEVMVHLQDRARRTRLADLVVDFGELGRHIVPIEQRTALEAVQEGLVTLWAQRSSLVRTRLGAWSFLRAHWFEPVTTLLGYGLEPLSKTEPETIPETDALLVWRLTVDERLESSIGRTTSRLLIPTADLEGTLAKARTEIDRALSVAGVREALLTDGSRWTIHRRGSSLTRTIWHLGECVADEVRLRSMLAELGDGL